MKETVRSDRTSQRAGGWCEPGTSKSYPNITPEHQAEIQQMKVGSDGFPRYRKRI